MLPKTRIVVPPSKGHTPLLPSLTPLSGTREGTFRAMITLAAKKPRVYSPLCVKALCVRERSSDSGESDGLAEG